MRPAEVRLIEWKLGKSRTNIADRLFVPHYGSWDVLQVNLSILEILEPLLGIMGPYWTRLGPSWGLLLPCGAMLWGCPGAAWFRQSWAHPGTILGPSWDHFGSLVVHFDHLGSIFDNLGAS